MRAHLDDFIMVLLATLAGVALGIMISLGYMALICGGGG